MAPLIDTLNHLCSHSQAAALGALGRVDLNAAVRARWAAASRTAARDAGGTHAVLFAGERARLVAVAQAEKQQQKLQDGDILLLQFWVHAVFRPHRPKWRAAAERAGGLDQVEVRAAEEAAEARAAGLYSFCLSLCVCCC